MHIVVLQVNREVGQRIGIHILDLHAHLTVGQFLTKDGSLLQCVDGSVGINTTLEAEAGIGAQSMTTGTLANPCRMEVSTLEHHVCGCLIRTTTLSTEHTSYTHRLLRIADGQILVRQAVLHTVECHELRTLGHGLHHDLMTGNHICIEAVERLTVCHHDVVGDVHDIVDRTKTDGGQLVLQPLRTLLHFTISDAYTSIALASLLILDHHLNRQRLVVNGKLTAVRTMQGCLITVLLQPCIEVTCHTPV